MATQIMQASTLVSGNAVSGRVTLLHQAVAAGRIFVTRRLLPQHYPAIRDSAAIVCQDGGPADHGCVIARILGRPVLLLKAATTLLVEGEDITLDVDAGCVHRGLVVVPSKAHKERAARSLQLLNEANKEVQTSIIGAAEIEAINALPVSRVRVARFFIRSELMWATLGVSDPYRFAEARGSRRVATMIAEYIGTAVRRLRGGQSINFRSIDWRSDERHNPTGVAEANPVLGFHGIRRTLRELPLLHAELQALQELNEQLDGQVEYSLPFVCDAEEVKEVVRIAECCGADGMRPAVFIETAAAVSELPFMLEFGVSHVYIGTKDLTQMILGCDRSNASVAHIYSSRKRPVVEAIRHVVMTCESRRVKVTLFSDSVDLQFFLLTFPSITGLSVCAGDLLASTVGGALEGPAQTSH